MWTASPIERTTTKQLIMCIRGRGSTPYGSTHQNGSKKKIHCLFISQLKLTLAVPSNLNGDFGRFQPKALSAGFEPAGPTNVKKP